MIKIKKIIVSFLCFSFIITGINISSYAMSKPKNKTTVKKVVKKPVQKPRKKRANKIVGDLNGFYKAIPKEDVFFIKNIMKDADVDEIQVSGIDDENDFAHIMFGINVDDKWNFVSLTYNNDDAEKELVLWYYVYSSKGCVVDLGKISTSITLEIFPNWLEIMPKQTDAINEMADVTSNLNDYISENLKDKDIITSKYFKDENSEFEVGYFFSNDEKNDDIIGSTYTFYKPHYKSTDNEENTN